MAMAHIGDNVINIATDGLMRNPRRGAILLCKVLILSFILLGMAGGLVAVSTQQTRERAGYEIHKDEFSAAEVALNAAFGRVQFLVTMGTPDFDAEMASVDPPVVEGITFTNFSVSPSFAGDEEVTDGQWQGMTIYRRRYDVAVTAKKDTGLSGRPGVSLVQVLEISYLPLFNFAIFYDPIMEIAPGPNMIVNGRVHCNGDAYIQANNRLDFQNRVTVAGDIRHGRHPDSGQASGSGDVTFFDGTSQSSMKRSTGDSDSSGWLDSADSDWVSASSDRYNSHVRSGEHGARPLALPIPAVDDPRSIIERADPDNDSLSLQQEKFEYKAGLKITADSAGVLPTNADGVPVGKDNAGNDVMLDYYIDSSGTAVFGHPPAVGPDSGAAIKSIVTSNSFYDAREQKTVTSLDIDLGNMKESGAVPLNGILYVSNEDTHAGARDGVVRLVNGADLPESPLTTGFSVASDDPLYIQGDFNSANKTLAMVAGDAVTVLSNQWNDANSSNFSSRVANNTTVNAVCLGGIVPSERVGGSGTYSGGVENYFRFLEKWSGRTLTFSGSIINLWESQKALGRWKYGSPVYEAPNRVWSWDTSLGGMNGPPGAPRVVEIGRINWSMPKR